VRGGSGGRRTVEPGILPSKAVLTSVLAASRTDPPAAKCRDTTPATSWKAKAHELSFRRRCVVRVPSWAALVGPPRGARGRS
jgi:hypothetical protein